LVDQRALKTVGYLVVMLDKNMDKKMVTKSESELVELKVVYWVVRMDGKKDSMLER